MSKSFLNLLSCLALTTLLISACQPARAATPAPPTATLRPSATPMPPTESPAPAQISFVSNGQNITSTDSWDVHLVDLNGDKTLDAYFGKRVWSNDGKGNFTKTDITFGACEYANFADLNGDGFVDVVCNNTITFNDGKFSFSRTAQIPSDIDMVSAAFADLNGDGHIDIISAGEVQDRILINDGEGNFTNTQKSLGGWGQSRYAVGDINGDGFTDIYVAIPHLPPMGGHTSNKIWLGDGKGSFTGSDHDIPGAESRSALLADFDGDGDLDLYVSNGVSRGMLWFNDGKGNFTDSGQVLGAHPGPAKTADFDRDGDLDLFICQGDGNGLFGNGGPSTLWLNDGKGHFTDSNQRLQLGNSNSIAMDIGDLNGDGRIDAIVVNMKLDQNGTPSPSPVEIWLNETVQ